MAVSEIECINWTRRWSRCRRRSCSWSRHQSWSWSWSWCQQQPEPLAVHSGHGWWLSCQRHTYSHTRRQETVHGQQHFRWHFNYLHQQCDWQLLTNKWVGAGERERRQCTMGSNSFLINVSAANYKAQTITQNGHTHPRSRGSHDESCCARSNAINMATNVMQLNVMYIPCTRKGKVPTLVPFPVPPYLAYLYWQRIRNLLY